jgi:nucleoside-diphosphate-sugar epimerase
MRVLVAGSTGVIGRQLIPLLQSAGHEVLGMSRSGRAPDHKVVKADALDRDQVVATMRTAKPDAVVNILTAIPANLNPRKIGAEMAMTGRLRTEGTRNLFDAARSMGVERVISEGVAYMYQPAPDLADEDAPLWTRDMPQVRPIVDALVEMERRTVEMNGLVLRFGHLYGPGSMFAQGGTFIEQIKSGRVPLVGGGHGVFSFTHARDAAMAILAGLDKNVSGALNIVDDTPAPLHEWLPATAGMLGVKSPKAAPAWLARLAVGPYGVAFMNQLRGADNARARLMLDWRPGYRSWRDGFTAELSGQ